MTEAERGSADTFSEHFMTQEEEEDSSRIMNFVEVKCEPPSPETDHEEEIADDEESKAEAVVEEEADPCSFIMAEPPFIKFEPVWSSNTEESLDLESSIQLPVDDLVKVESTNSVNEEFELEGVKEEENGPAEDLLNETQSPLESSNSILPTPDSQTTRQVNFPETEDTRPLKCSTCKKIFYGSDQLKAHKLLHASVRPYSCNICGKSFTQRTILKRHLIIHSVDRPHSCPYCSKSFTRSDYLKSHLLVHSENRPLTCDTCGKTFLRLSHLKSHVLRHSGEKPFLCISCGKTFFSSSSLKRHTKKKSHVSLPTI